jgi:hypothetical protein
MCDFARHQELQRVLGTDIVAEIDQSLVDDLGAGFRRDVAAQIDVELAGDLEIICRPSISLRVEQVNRDPAPSLLYRPCEKRETLSRFRFYAENGQSQHVRLGNP